MRFSTLIEFAYRFVSAMLVLMLSGAFIASAALASETTFKQWISDPETSEKMKQEIRECVDTKTAEGYKRSREDLTGDALFAFCACVTVDLQRFTYNEFILSKSNGTGTFPDRMAAFMLKAEPACYAKHAQ